MRPVGDALHEGIDRDDSERGDAEQDREAVELQQHRERRPAPAGPGRPAPAAGSTWPEGSGRERVRSTLRVEVAVDDVVVGAAGAAHGDRADQEQQQVPRDRAAARRSPARDRARKRRRPPARPQQQPPADRPVPARQLRIGPQRPRQQPVDPMAARRVGDAALAVLGLDGLHARGVAGEGRRVKLRDAKCLLLSKAVRIYVRN